MEQKITSIIQHMAKSHQELARIIQAKKDVVVQMSAVIQAIPDMHGSFKDVDTVSENSIQVAKSVTAYLNGLAELEEAMADNLSDVIKEMTPEPVPEEE
ncbi:nucleoside-diphosphate sugar epimerase [Paenibacillus tarimensis]